MPLRALKILVAVMGVMLVAGVATLIVVIAGRMPPRQAAAIPAPPFAAAPIELPAGARVETIGVGSDRVVLILALPDGDRQLVIIDLASGHRVGTVPLRSTTTP